MTTITLEGKEYQLNIEQAKQLGLLKEKYNKVKSWEEFKEKYSNKILWAVSCQLTSHEATALEAFSKLLKLRRDWVGEWEPDWGDIDASYGVIWIHKNKLQANTACTPSRSLSFPDYEMAKDFLETFRELITEAKILI